MATRRAGARPAYPNPTLRAGARRAGGCAPGPRRRFRQPGRAHDPAQHARHLCQRLERIPAARRARSRRPACCSLRAQQGLAAALRSRGRPRGVCRPLPSAQPRADSHCVPLAASRAWPHRAGLLVSGLHTIKRRTGAPAARRHGMPAPTRQARTDIGTHEAGAAAPEVPEPDGAGVARGHGKVAERVAAGRSPGRRLGRPGHRAQWHRVRAPVREQAQPIARPGRVRLQPPHCRAAVPARRLAPQARPSRPGAPREPCPRAGARAGAPAAPPSS